MAFSLTEESEWKTGAEHQPVLLSNQSAKLQEQQDLIGELQGLLSLPGGVGLTQRPQTAPLQPTQHTPFNPEGEQVSHETDTHTPHTHTQTHTTHTTHTTHK